MFTLYNDAPQPPVDMVMPSLFQTVFIVATLVVLVILLIYCIRLSIKDRDPVPALAVLGGVIAGATVEFVYGPLGLLWYPAVDQISFVEFAGRSIPVFVALGMGFWYGPGLVILGNVLKKHPSSKVPWIAFGVIAAIDLFMEIPGTAMGVFCYYGDQGLRVGGFPVWWCISNASLTILGAWLIGYLRDVYLKGWRSMLVILVIPSLATAVNSFNAIYAWLGVNSAEPALIYLGTILTVIMALISVDFVAHRCAANSGFVTTETDQS